MNEFSTTVIGNNCQGKDTYFTSYQSDGTETFACHTGTPFVIVKVVITTPDKISCDDKSMYVTYVKYVLNVAFVLICDSQNKANKICSNYTNKNYPHNVSQHVAFYHSVTV